jgi:phosphatidate cytidylyltransferase
MKKVFQRLIIFFVGLPVLLSLVLFFPHYNHLLLNLAIIVFSALSAMEVRNILSQKNMLISTPEAAILGALSPASWTLVISFGITEQIVPSAFALGAIWLLVSGAFTSQEKLGSYIGRVATGFTVLIYPGFFTAWIIRMTEFREAGVVILIFFLMVLLNDSAAWLTGMLFGKGNRGLIAASPNKSVAGFAGGLFASVLTGITATALLPGAFSSDVIPQIPAGLVLGFLVGAAATLGDLCESAIKRSAEVKDSGSIILGRGGALDSIDSLILAAPVYFLIYRALFYTT